MDDMANTLTNTTACSHQTKQQLSHIVSLASLADPASLASLAVPASLASLASLVCWLEKHF
jgi:hypothetical protein